MIVADLIQWLKDKPMTDTVFIRDVHDAGRHIVLDTHFMWTDATRVYDLAAARRFEDKRDTGLQAI